MCFKNDTTPLFSKRDQKYDIEVLQRIQGTKLSGCFKKKMFISRRCAEKMVRNSGSLLVIIPVTTKDRPV